MTTPTKDTQNPIIRPSQLKHSAIPFDKIRPEHFLPALEQAIEHGRKILQQIKAKKVSEANFVETIRDLEASTEEIEFVSTLFSNLLAAQSDDELQNLSLEVGPRVAAFANEILLDSELFARVSSIYDRRNSLSLKKEQIYLVEKIYRDFERSGAGLDESKKDRLRAIDERLAQLHPKFRDNVLKATNAFELWLEREEDLAGLPNLLREAARESAKEKGQEGKWLFTLQAPSYLPFMQFSRKRELREKMYRAYNSKAFGDAFDNQEIVLEMARLMQERARLLGCPSYTHYALQLRMAETPEKVMQFLNKILVAAKPAALREVQEVQALAKEMDGLEELKAWDFHYYSERLKEKKYSFDEEQLRPYFQLDNVIKGVFEHARRLFNLTFVECHDYPVYHEDVRVYEVYKVTERGEKGDFIGLFYADFFPRASKSGGAWMTNFREQGVYRGQKLRPHISIVCNFTKPTVDQPSLLTFDEVRTLFHEFGHALHGLLSQVEHRSFAGTSVYLDFVELPSQILENWAEEEESLRLFAFHYKTGETIPMELIDRLKRAQKFLVGYSAVRQLNFALLDLAWFTNPPGPKEDIATFEARMTEPTRLLPAVRGANISTSFAHIFGGGYASGYYSYKWAEALDADAFELFKEKGIFDRETAQRFEEFVLSKGGSDHPMRLYEQFRGKSPDPEALLRRDGLINP